MYLCLIQKSLQMKCGAGLQNIAGNNISDLIRLLKLIKDVSKTFNEELTIQRVRILCSAPFYMDFFPFTKSHL